MKVDITREELLKLVDAILYGYSMIDTTDWVEYCQFCTNDLHYPHHIDQHTEGCVVHLATEVKEGLK